MQTKEDRCSENSFEDRFYSGALLDDVAVIDAKTYADLNPKNVRIVQGIADYDAASGSGRNHIAMNYSARLPLAIVMIVSGIIQERPELSVSLETYLDIVECNA